MGSYNLLLKARKLTGHVLATTSGVLGISAVYQGISANDLYRTLIGCVGLFICAEIERSIYLARSHQRILNSINRVNEELKNIERDILVDISFFHTYRDNRNFFQDLEDRAN